MKRNDFLKVMVSFSGGAFLISCTSEMVGDLLENSDPEGLSLTEAQAWFESTYNGRGKSMRTDGSKPKPERKAAWEYAKNSKTNKNANFTWVPIEYMDGGRPGVVLCTEETKYRVELSRFFLQPIVEVLIVHKVKGENKAFLAQIAYEPIQVAANGNRLEKSNFTGTLLRTDWDDNLIDGTIYKNGTATDGFENSKNVIKKNGRVPFCDTHRVYYQTYDVRSGIFTVIEHHYDITDCTGNGGGSEGGYSESYYIPNFSGDGAQGPGLSGPNLVPVNDLTSFYLDQAINGPGISRDAVNDNLRRTMLTVGLIAGIHSWSYDKADALARSAGVAIKDYFPRVHIASKYLGWFSVALSGREMFVGFGDGEWNVDDAKNVAQVALGVGAVVLGGWVAVGLGAVSLFIVIVNEQ